MTQERGLATIQPSVALTIQDLEDSFAIAVRQRELLEDYIQKRMTPGKHFYKVPGSKNSLTKEGAELICLPHGYRPRYTKEGGPDQPLADNAPYQITVRCTLIKGDSFAGEGLGSASSYTTKRDGTYKPRQNDPGLCHNATLKMAQKSAYIAATLNATAASEFFTQDIEDGAEEHQSGSTGSPQENAHWCAEHKTAWFKRGKMRNYAHPIGDTKEWCHQPDHVDIVTGEIVEARVKEAQEQGIPPQGQESPTIENVGQFLTWATATYGYKNSAAICVDMGVEKPVQILQLHKTWDEAVAYLTAKHALPVPQRGQHATEGTESVSEEEAY